MVIAALVDSNKHEKNGVVQLKHLLKYIDEKTTVNWKNTQLTFLGMVNVPVFMNSEHLDVTSIMSHQNLRN